MLPSEKLPPITFFFPYHEVSGVPVLFLRMAEFLADHLGLSVFVIDYPDGYMSRNLNARSQVSVIPFLDGTPLHVSAETLLVMQSALPFTMHSELQIHPETRVLFWTLHPHNLVQTILPSPFFRQLQQNSPLFQQIGLMLLFPRLVKNLRKLVVDMHAKKSILFMDGSTLRTTTESLGVELSAPLMLPVPSGDTAENLRIMNSRRPEKNINFCWVGRLANFKIFILLYILEKLKSYSVAKHITITAHIIGDGPEADKLQIFSEPCDYFKIKMVGSLSKSELDHYLINSVDVVAAMGTSALEGARLGVPTILLDFSSYKVPEGYRFKWLHESQDYTLGEVIDARHIMPGNSSLETMIDDVLKTFNLLSNQAYEYYRTNHSISLVAEKFISAAASAKFRYSDFDAKIFNKGLIRKIYEYCRL